MINLTLDDLDCIYEILIERRKENEVKGTLREDLLFAKLNNLFKKVDDVKRKEIVKEHLEEVLPPKL